VRGSWTTARLAVAAPEPPPAPAASRWGVVGQAVGLLLLAATFAAAVIGPDEQAANISPVTVFVMWAVGLPLLCLVVGDVMRWINPFQLLLRGTQAVLRRSDPIARGASPSWTPAAFLFAFSWVFLAYYKPGSPRVVALVLVAYTVAAVAGGLLWGRDWLATGEAWGALSAAVARLTHRRAGPRPPGLLPLVVVWVGATAFDGVSSTKFWVDLLGTSQGWERALIDTVGLVWIVAVAAAVVLLVLRVGEDDLAEAEDGDEPARRGRPSLVALAGVAFLPLATGWFVAHDLTLLLYEGQNFYALLSDPLGRGWDLFGTIDHSIDFRLVQGGWVRWVQLGALLIGHTATVVLAHDGAIARYGRRRGMRITWTVAVAAAASVVASALLVIK